MAGWIVAGVSGRPGACDLLDDGAVACHAIYRKCDGRLARRLLGQYGSRKLLVLDGCGRHGCGRGRCPSHSTAQIDSPKTSCRVIRPFKIGSGQWPGGSAADKTAKLVGEVRCGQTRSFGDVGSMSGLPESGMTGRFIASRAKRGEV